VYDEKDVLGDFTITGTDETVSEGAIKGRGYFDYVNVGDQVVFQTISVSEYESLSADAAAGVLRMTPENVLLQEQPDRFPRA
jgi:hypothetical protein